MLQVVDGPVAPKIHCGTEGTEGGTSREHFRGGAPYPGRLKRYGRRACGRESDAAGRKVRHAERRDVRARSEREGDGERHPLRAAPLRAAAGRQSRGSCCSPAAPHHSWRPPYRCRQPCSAQVMRTPCPARGEPGRAEQREGQRERERETGRWGVTGTRRLEWTRQVGKHRCWQESRSGEMQSVSSEEGERILHCTAMTWREGRKDRGSSIAQGRIQAQGQP